MLLSEWNWDDARKVWTEEGIELGEARGKASGIELGEAHVLELLKAMGQDTGELEALLKGSRSAP